MAFLDAKYHIKIDDKGYLLDRNKGGVFAYQKKRAPSFVNRTSTGDLTYRDSTIWQYWAQINWRNGSKQEKWGDGGKFWKSENLDVTQMEQVKLSKAFESIGQVASGVKVNTLSAWRSSTSWWDNNYGNRQQLSITAPADKALPVGYPIKCAIDTAALQTAGKVRSDRNDWRIVYWNGTTWVDLSRDYVSTTNTIFALQVEIPAGATNSNYYAYYGKAGEMGNKQPNSDATWNAVYGMYGITPDSNSVAIWHGMEASGTTIVDTKGSADMSSAGGASVGAAGPFGRALVLTGRSGDYFQVIDDAINLGSVTIEAWVKFNSFINGVEWVFGRSGGTPDIRQFDLGVNSTGKPYIHTDGYSDAVSSEGLSTNTWYHISGTNDGVNQKIYVNGVLKNTASAGAATGSTGAKNTIGANGSGGDQIDGWVAHLRISNAARTSFPYAGIGTITATAGTAITTQPPASTFTLYAGTSGGKIYSWDGNSTFTEANAPGKSVNCSLITSIGGTQKLLFGTGDPSSVTNEEAKIISFDGSNWATNKTFTTATEAQVTSLTEFSSKVYAGVGPQGRVYESTDISTYSLSKDIDFPQKPGYVNILKEYNSQLIAGGGSPEFLSDKHYDGFAFVYNGTLWQSLYPFDHTVLTCAEFYDAFLFMGTYHGQIYTYNTSFLDPLFSFKDDYGYKVQIKCMKYFDDKLYIGTYPQDNVTEPNVGIYVFDRHGISLIGKIANVAGITSMEQVNNTLIVGTGDNGYVYKQSDTNYNATGWLQTSYFDANLPSIIKLWSQIEINHDPLLEGQTIAISYRFKESDDWTTLTGTQTVGSTSTLFPFPAGISSKKISVKITLSTTNITTTPILREFVVRYSVFPVVKYEWNLRLKAKSPMQLGDGSIDERSGEAIRSELEGLLSDTQMHTLTDIDGSTHTVLFYDLDESSWVVDQSDTSGATIPLTLIEA